MHTQIEFHEFFRALRNDEVEIVYRHPVVAEALAALGRKPRARPAGASDERFMLYVFDNLLSQDSLQTLACALRQSGATGMLVPLAKRSEALQTERVQQLFAQIFALDAVDIARTLHLRRAALALMVDHAGVEARLLDGKLAAHFSPEGRLDVLNPHFSIRHGSLYNLGHFLELACVNRARQSASVVLSGGFPFAGVVYEGNRRCISSRLDLAIRQLNADLAADADSNRLYIDNNTLVDVQSRGLSLLDRLRQWLPDDQRQVTEFSFGCNAALYHTVDFSDGSILNETVEGLHVGIGWPEQLHLDFILPMRLDRVFAPGCVEKRPPLY
jgi:hypothetical protein